MKTLTNVSNEKTSFGEAFGLSGIDVPLSGLIAFGNGTNVVPNQNFIFDKDLLKQVIFSLKETQNLLLWGDAGAGKTDLIEQVAARLNRQAFIISFGEETSVRQLVGSFTLSQGETPWRDGALLSAIRVENAIIGLDEINMAHPGVVAMLNHLLQKKELVLPETGEVVKCANGVAFIATSNTNMGVDESGLFEGSQSQNAATRSRFAGAHVKYLKEADEIRLIDMAYPSLDEAIPPLSGKRFSELTVQLANALRSAMREGGLSLPFSVRQIHCFVKSSLAFKDASLAFKYSYWNLLDSVERQTASDLFKTVFNLEISE
ncbi:AAA family ATPase [Thiomicrorhabdus aquaedulcis]|uniref:AAA family ATPase n=1 Tax=Thiomicrorhabdus aquaedulcis TaxID=2211106 RepID=UPI0015625603|nr:AAA family ATPase [Thiomicrorhabdus aquaedulcis]